MHIDTDSFTVFMFFSVGKEPTLFSLHGKISSWSFITTSDDTRGLFAGNFRSLPSPGFYPLKFFFLSAKSFVFHVQLCHLELFVGWILLEAPRFTTFFIPPKVLVLKCWEHDMCKFAVDWNSTETPCQLAGKKMLHFFRSFFSLGNLKNLRSGRFLELFLHTEMAQYLIFICFAFKISPFVVSLFPWASSWCSKIVTRLLRPNNSKLGYYGKSNCKW